MKTAAFTKLASTEHGVIPAFFTAAMMDAVPRTRVCIEIGILPTRVEGTDKCLVTLDQLCKRIRVINVSSPCN